MTKSIQQILDEQKQQSKIYEKSEHSINLSIAKYGTKFTDEHRKNISIASKQVFENLTDEQKRQRIHSLCEGYKKISPEVRANMLAARQNVRDETRKKQSESHRKRHAENPVTQETKQKAVATRRARGSYFQSQASIDKARATKANRSPDEKFWSSTAQPLIAGEYGIFESRRELEKWSRETKIWLNAGKKFDKLKSTDPKNYRFISKQEYILLTGKYK